MEDVEALPRGLYFFRLSLKIAKKKKSPETPNI